MELGEEGSPDGSIFWDAVDAGLATAFSPVPEAAHMLMLANANVQTHLVHPQDSGRAGYSLAVVHNNETPLSPVRDDKVDFA